MFSLLISLDSLTINLLVHLPVHVQHLHFQQSIPPASRSFILPLQQILQVLHPEHHCLRHTSGWIMEMERSLDNDTHLDHVLAV